MKLAFISDIHEDVIRLREAMRIIEKKQVDEIICLGDIVGYGAPYYGFYESRNAGECVNIIRNNCKRSFAGNHDIFAIRKIPKFCKDFSFPENWYDLDYEERVKLGHHEVWLYEDHEMSSMLNTAARNYLKEMPEYEFVEYDGIKFLFSHFQIPDPTGSVIFFPEYSFELDEHFDFMKNNNCNFSFFGHMHNEGALYVDKENFELKPFGHFHLDKNSWAVSTPGLVNGTTQNGFLIFDTQNFELEVFPLNSPTFSDMHIEKLNLHQLRLSSHR